MASKNHNKVIWTTLSRAIDAEIRTGHTIRGASGLDHSVEAISVDDKNRRVIIVSAEINPRVAALIQADIQATMADVHVLVARPIAFDIAAVARSIAQQFQWTELDIGELTKKFQGLQSAKGTDPDVKEIFGDAFTPVARAFSNVRLPPLNQIISIIQQAAFVDWRTVVENAKADPSRIAIPLVNLLTMDSMEADLRHGVCPIPLYELGSGPIKGIPHPSVS